MVSPEAAVSHVDLEGHGLTEHEVLDLHAIVSVTDQAGRIVYVNDRFCDVSGYAREELIGQNHRLLKSGRHDDDYYQGMWKTISRGETWHGEFCNRRKDGSFYWVESTVQPIKDSKGRIVNYFSIRTEITRLKEAEALNREYEQRLRIGQIYANVGTWDWRIDTGELFWTEQIGPLFGYPQGDLEVTYDNFLNAIHPEDRSKVETAIKNSIERDAPYEIEHRVVWPDGTVRWLLERGGVKRDAAGNPIQMLGVVQDIDDRKRMELALSERERQLSEAQKIARIGHWQADVKTGKLRWSDQIFEIFGRDPDCFVPSIEAFHEAVHPDDRHIVSASEIEAAETGLHDVIHRIVRPDGTVRHVRELARAEFDDDGNIDRLVGTVQDITDQVISQQKLRRSEDLFAFAVSATGDCVWELMIHSGLITFAGQYGRILGLEETDLPTHLAGWLAMVHEEDIATVNKCLEECRSGESSSFNCEIRLKYEGQGYKWILCRGTATDFDANGLPTRIVAIHTDISRRKVAERALVEAREEADRANKAKSDFLSSMSHELRTPLNSILGFAQLMEFDTSLSDDNKDNIQEIRRAGRHLLDLINEVLDLAKIESENYTFSIEPVAVEPLVNDCLALMSPLAQSRQIQLTARLEQSPNVLSDHIRLKQVLLNLLSNAIKYNHPAGDVIIEGRSSSDRFFQLSITDTGPGIPEDKIPQLFEPFNRLGAEQSGIEGTGIGLAISRKLVELMNGRIFVSSKPGRGCTFTIEIPIIDQSTADIDHACDACEEKQFEDRSTTVLCIEDNAANVKLFRQIMAKRPSIHFVAVHDPYLGLDLARSLRPDLIFLDINLPGLDGYELLEALKHEQITDNCAVIAVSANAMPKDIAKGREAGFSEYITKPINVPGLLAAVDRVLGLV